MSNHAVNGRAREHRVRHALEARGWTVYRSAGSKGAADLLCALYPRRVLLQIGTAAKRLGPADRLRLLGDALAFDADAVVAICTPGKPPTYRRVLDAPPSAWPTYDMEAS